MIANNTTIRQMALYKLCMGVYGQYLAQHEHQHNEGLARLHAEVEEYLNISVDDIEDEVVITFVLKRSDLDGRA